LFCREISQKPTYNAGLTSSFTIWVFYNYFIERYFYCGPRRAEK